MNLEYKAHTIEDIECYYVCDKDKLAEFYADMVAELLFPIVDELGELYIYKDDVLKSLAEFHFIHVWGYDYYTHYYEGMYMYKNKIYYIPDDELCFTPEHEIDGVEKVYGCNDVKKMIDLVYKQITEEYDNKHKNA